MESRRTKVVKETIVGTRRICHDDLLWIIAQYGHLSIKVPDVRLNVFNSSIMGSNNTIAVLTTQYQEITRGNESICNSKVGRNPARQWSRASMNE